MAELSRRGLIVVVGGGTVAAAYGLANPFGVPGVSLRRRRHRTSFGSVTLLGSTRIAAHRGRAHGAAHAATGTGRVTDSPVTSPVHGAYTDAVVVDLDIRNERTELLPLSPGQFRLQVGADGPTVSLYSADHDAGVLPRGSARRMRITYLAPPPDRALALAFDDTGAASTLLLGGVGSTTGSVLS